MAGSVNKAIIIGNLGKAPEARSMQNGGKVVSFSVATSESWKDKNSGERQERTQWHNVVIFNEALAGVAEKFLKKGSKVYVEGQIETRKWQDKEGTDRYSTEIVLRPYRGELTLLDKAEGGGEPRATSGADYYAPSDRKAAPNVAQVDDLEDEIPF